MADYPIQIPNGYQIDRRVYMGIDKDRRGENVFVLLCGGNFVFSGKNVEECFDAWAKIYTGIKYGKSYSHF
jgi:hypothetical protein